VVALHQKYGNVVRVSPNTLSFIGTQQAWSDIYGFKKSGIPENYKDPEFYMKSFNGHYDLVRSPDSHHGRQRKVVSHGFSERALKEQEPMLKSYANKLSEFLIRKAASGKSVDMVLAFNFATFDIMGEWPKDVYLYRLLTHLVAADLTFAESLHMLDMGKNEKWVRNIFASIKFKNYIRAARAFSFFTRVLVTQLTTRIPSIKKRAADHFKFTTDRVAKRLSHNSDRPDIFTRIIEKGGHPTAPNPQLPLGELQVIAAMFMLAGTETTATGRNLPFLVLTITDIIAALSGLTYHLLRHPEWMKKLQDEVRSSLSGLDDMNLHTLARLPILEACIKEALRMFPPVPNGTPRVASHDGVLVAGWHVPKGTQMFVHHLATYRAEQIFKHAAEFHPERWMGYPEFKNDSPDAFEPWVVGPRACIGKAGLVELFERRYYD